METGLNFGKIDGWENGR